MDNIQMINYLSAVYNCTQKADVFIIGFNIDGIVQFAQIPLETLWSFCGISMTSDEVPCKRLRVKPINKKNLAIFNSFNPQILCTFDELQETAKNQFSGNCGQCFEKMVCNFMQGEQTPPNTPFWIDGDFKVNGLTIQAKFQMATVITEYTAKQAEKECMLKV